LKNAVSTGIGALGGVLGVVLPFPAVTISSVLFSIVSGIISGLGRAPSPDNTFGDAAVQKLFRHRFRSSKARLMALTGEWSWYKDLFTNDFIAQYGATYEAASLSWLLNAQHDMALDRELFFNVDCLDVTEKNSFSSISVGRCEDVGMWPISDASLCEVAAHHVKNYSMDAHSIVVQLNEESKAKGCYWSSLNGAPMPYVNSHPDAKEGAQTGSQLLCTTMEPEAQQSCATWQEGSSWQVSKWYVALHLGVLVDIFKTYPPLRNSTLSRIADTTAEYVLLLTHAFKASVYKRLGYLSAPVVSRLVCSVGFWWAGATYMVRDGYDYWVQSLGTDSRDENCTGQCDVLSLACDVDPGQTSGWFHDRSCVNASRADEAVSCFQSYKNALLTEMSASFTRDIQKLEEFSLNMTRALQGGQ
jgi:hypothetical protein